MSLDEVRSVSCTVMISCAFIWQFILSDSDTAVFMMLLAIFNKMEPVR